MYDIAGYADQYAQKAGFLLASLWSRICTDSSHVLEQRICLMGEHRINSGTIDVVSCTTTSTNAVICHTGASEDF